MKAQSDEIKIGFKRTVQGVLPVGCGFKVSRPNAGMHQIGQQKMGQDIDQATEFLFSLEKLEFFQIGVDE